MSPARTIPTRSVLAEELLDDELDELLEEELLELLEDEELLEPPSRRSIRRSQSK